METTWTSKQLAAENLPVLVAKNAAGQVRAYVQCNPFRRVIVRVSG
jgi:hypothetical protein